MIPSSSFSRSIRGVTLATAALVLAGHASAANLVQNGGFESGDFGGWTQIGNITFNGVQCPGTGLVAEGRCDGFFGPTGSSGGIQQSLSTVAGSPYVVSFVLTGDGSGGSFAADFGSVNLLSLANIATGAKTYSFTTIASAATTLLRFQFRDDLGFAELDAVQVAAPVPEPSTLALLGIGLAGVTAGVRRRRVRID